MTALKASQGLFKVTDHIKNYRPKILVLSGKPSHRQNLVDFGHLITKKISLMSTLDIVDENSLSWRSLDKLKQESQRWLLDNKIKAFHGMTRNNSFSEGVRAALELQGLSKLSPNMMMVGFKENWREEGEGSLEYYQALHTAMDMGLAVAILRLPASYHEAREEGDTPTVQREVPDIRISLDSGLDIDQDAVINIPEQVIQEENVIRLEESVDDLDDNDEKALKQSPFRLKKVQSGSSIDIYWLYDDGGLTLLVPHILHTRKIYRNCKMRIFFLCNKIEQLDMETRAMVALLARFRIEADDVIIISDAMQRPSEASVRDFEEMMMDSVTEGEDEVVVETRRVTEEDLEKHREKTNFYLRISEVDIYNLKLSLISFVSR